MDFSSYSNIGVQMIKGQSDDSTSKWSDYSWCSIGVHSDILSDYADTLSIESLRKHYNSCSSCGVSWYIDQVSLDCQECGGYAMFRPCPKCDGKCESIWRRDTESTHENKKAAWEGECKLDSQWKQPITNSPQKMKRSVSMQKAL